MDIINWLMSGDTSIKYQVSKDLLHEDVVIYEKYQQEIHKSGWCKRLIDLWNPKTKMWGNGIYSPKWVSTTYTMLDLKNFRVDPKLNCYQQAAKLLIDEMWVNRSSEKEYPLDLCICGMLLNLSCYCNLYHPAINDIVDTLLEYHMDDGAWNCDLCNHPHHSSLHTTINILEGFLEYEQNNYTYRLGEIQKMVSMAHEFILLHHMYKSDKTGEIIKKSFTMLSYPPRWKYDVLRALYYFSERGVLYDQRMDDAIKILIKKQRKDGSWPVQQKYSGLVHFDYEKTGNPSRINTLRALKVLNQYNCKV